MSHSSPHTPAQSDLSTAVSWGCLQAFANALLETSLVVQWVRLHTPSARSMGLITCEGPAYRMIRSKNEILMLFYTLEQAFLGSSAGKESPCNAGDPSLIPALGRASGEGIGYPLQYAWASQVAQLVKNPPAVWETWVPSLGWEDPLEKGKATHSSILENSIDCIVHGVTRSWT